MAVTIQLRNDISTNWATANPVLLIGEIGIETDTMLYKLGNGSDNWNDLPYAILGLSEVSNSLEMINQESHPATPSANRLRLYNKSIAGRNLPHIKGPSGLSTPLQPSFFQNQIAIISPSVTTTLTVLGTAVTSAGTLSHPVATESAGYMTNFVTAAAASVAGTGDNVVRWFRGSVPGANGFFYYSRVFFPDSSYDYTAASTGSRFYAGLTSTTLILMAQSNNHASARCAFVRIHDGTRNDANFFFTTRATTGDETLTDTGMIFIAQNIYDFYIYCRPQSDTIYWRIDNLTTGTSYEGMTSETLPEGNTAMRAGIQLCTINALARNIRMQRIYIESDY